MGWRAAVRIDKVTVWNNAVYSNGNGSSTSNFIANMMISVPPLGELINMAGMDLPKALDKANGEVSAYLAKDDTTTKPSQNDDLKDAA